MKSILLFIFIFSFSCVHQNGGLKRQGKNVKLTILHVNDTHGHFSKYDKKDNPEVGGFAALSTLVKQVRREVKASGGHFLFLHGGDINTGVPDSDLLDAAPDIAALNKMKLDAVVIGNHEFDNSISVLKKQIELASFPFLSANVKLKKTNKLIGKPFIKKNIGGLNAYIIGLTTYRLDDLIYPKIYEELNLLHPRDAADEYIKRFDKKSLVIALTHLGVSEGGENKKKHPREYEDSDLAQDVSDIDIIVGGHSHTIIRDPLIVGKTLIVQAGSYTEGVGRLDVIINSGEVIDYRYRYIPINSKIMERVKRGGVKYNFIEKEIPEDKEILDLVEPYKKKIAFKLQEVIGYNKSFLKMDGRLSHEIALGNLLTDAMAKKGGCDASVIQGGGIRADLPDASVTIKHVFSIHPFGNSIVKSNVTGRELKKILENGFKEFEPRNMFLQVSGLKINVDLKKSSVDILEINEKAFDENGQYTLCTDDFLSNGGDSMVTLKNHHTKYDTGLKVHDGLIDFIKEKKTIDYEVEGRIRFTD